MANLETLFIEIEGNAGKAQGGIDNLITTLGKLEASVTNASKPLKDLATTLQEVQTIANGAKINWKQIMPTTSQSSVQNIKQTAAALRSSAGAFTKWSAAYLISNEALKASPMQSILNGQTASDASAYTGNAYAAQPVTSSVRDTTAPAGMHSYSTSAQMAQAASNALAQAANNAAQAMNNLGTASNQAGHKTKEAAKEAEESSGIFKKFAGNIGRNVSQITRMFKSMFLRTAIRSLIKAFSESWTAMYNYSKAMGGEFYQNVDKLRGAVSSVATNLLSAFAPALNAIIPVVNVVANAIKYLCDLIQQLFSLLGMSTEFFGVSAESIDKYSKSAGGGGSATKGMLASFDELNVIQNQSGGGGGGGSNKNKTFFSDMVSDEMARLAVIVGESLIGIGMILALCGHVPLGVGLMAIGAASIVKTVVNDWGKLSQEVKDEIANIMAIAAGALIALGLIVGLFGHPVIGVALIAAGAANLVAITAVSGDLSSEVQEKLAKITEIAGYSLLALGVILLCFGQIPLGIAMLVAGGASLAASVALDWGGSGILGAVWSMLKSLGSMFERVWGNITNVINLAWKAAEQWFGNVTGQISAGWSYALRWLSTTWEGVKNTIKNVWDIALYWFEDSYGLLSTAWSAGLRWLSTTWENVESVIAGAWNFMSDSWLKPAIHAIGLAWNGALTWLSNTWDAVSTVISDAWKVVAKWLEPIISPFKAVWEEVTGWFKSIWTEIAKAVGLAWAKVQSWWDESIGSRLEAAWSGVAKFLEPVLSAIKGIWDYIQKVISKVWTVKFDITTQITEIVKTAKKMTEEGTTENSLAKVALDVGKESSNPLVRFGTSILGSLFDAEGAYNIPKGDVFVANEAGAELVGSINGKTSVANQEQIIEGIQRGVAEANGEQNILLRQQNELLRGILEKESSVRLGASAALGRVARQSLDMYAGVVGG